MSDHFSGPAVIGDPSVDITDFYAFPSPERPGNLVLIMNVFPMATSQSFFSDVVTYRFRLRPLTRSGGSITHGAAEHTIEVTFSDVPEGSSVQKGHIVTSDGREASFVAGKPLEQHGMRVFAGLVSDPFFMDVEAAIRTDLLGRLSFETADEYRRVSRRLVDCRRGPVCSNRRTVRWRHTDRRHLGKHRHAPRQADPNRTPWAAGDQERRPGQLDPRSAHEGGRASRSLQPRRRLCALRGIPTALRVASRCEPRVLRWPGRQTAWPLGTDGRHPLRDLLMGDFLVLDLAHAFAPGGFLEIERSLIDNRPHESAGRSLAR